MLAGDDAPECCCDRPPPSGECPPQTAAGLCLAGQRTSCGCSQTFARAAPNTERCDWPPPLRAVRRSAAALVAVQGVGFFDASISALSLLITGVKSVGLHSHGLHSHLFALMASKSFSCGVHLLAVGIKVEFGLGLGLGLWRHRRHLRLHGWGAAGTAERAA